MTLFIHILPHIFIPTHNCAKNIHHFWKVLFRNDFRFINEAAYSVAKYDRLENKLVLFGSLVRATNPKCALFPHLATAVTTATVMNIIHSVLSAVYVYVYVYVLYKNCIYVFYIFYIFYCIEN